MKFKTFELNAYKSRAGITLSFDKKDRALGIITSKLFYLDSKHPLKLKITNNQAERYRIKQEIKQTEYKGKSPEGVMQLADIIEKKIILMDYHNANKENWQEWMLTFVYEYLYDVAFNRGIRHERQRRKSKETVLSAFDIIGADDVIELSNELGINEDRLTYAVLEVISKRKNGGKK
ncbi:hypothetical protein llh_12800 [Lactococcus cremoris subsp. cremoris A76]|uniref:hypothetical protein n=1 Tax=Lactococcus lactis subsp. cremoris TaxID=1359 RepID=UPI000238C7F2|nr:hypothetical protein [Lactococcus cremoris]AEU41736.1 hypothetical protein llh_12800 [Lactococcus cremoris subsp. cremoris A76]